MKVKEFIEYMFDKKLKENTMQRIETFYPYNSETKTIVKYAPHNIFVRNFLPKYFWRFFSQDVVVDITIVSDNK